jgi:hypothetical protein
MFINRISQFNAKSALNDQPEDKQKVLSDFILLLSVYSLKKSLTEDAEFRELFTLKKQGKLTAEQAALFDRKVKRGVDEAICTSNVDGDDMLTADDLKNELARKTETYAKLDADQNFYKQWLPQDGLGLSALADKVSKELLTLKPDEIFGNGFKKTCGL